MPEYEMSKSPLLELARHVPVIKSLRAIRETDSSLSLGYTRFKFIKNDDCLSKSYRDPAERRHGNAASRQHARITDKGHWVDYGTLLTEVTLDPLQRA